MSNKLLAGFLVGATFLATSLTAPAQARNNDYQNLLNQEAMQMYQQNLLNQQYASAQYGAQNGAQQCGYGQYGYGQYDLGSGIGAPGIDPSDPNAWQESQYRGWLQKQGGNMGYANHGLTNSQFNPVNNNGWNGQLYRVNNQHR
jgi:hypothetical protein